MRNDFPGRCKVCAAPVARGAGHLVSGPGRRSALQLVCDQHTETYLSDAQREFRHPSARTAAPVEPGTVIYFPDGSALKFTQGHWEVHA